METNKVELWKDIEGYEGLYAVSTFGNVKSLSKIQGTRIKPESIRKLRLAKHGYYMVDLGKNSRKKLTYAHRLVALTFIPNPDGKPQVNHINDIKTDNRLENLERVTGKENVKHAHRAGLKNKFGEFKITTKLTWAVVRDIRKMKIDGHSSIFIGEKYNISKRHISNIVAGAAWKE